MGFEIIEKTAVICMDDGKVNAVGYDFINAIYEAMDRSLEEANALIITGRPGMLSGGFDLGEFKKGPEATMKLVGEGARMMHRLFTHPQPLIMACTGHAIAAGAFMLLASDTRVGAQGNFKIGLNETAIGMTLPVFGVELATTRLSKRHVTQAMVQAQIYNPDGACAAGFLDEVVAAEEMMPRAMEHAAVLGGYSTEAYAANKLALRKPVAERIAASLR